eukprot:COSAG04_NODE_12366_length_656_cov_1.224417_2_plen_119_part_00
MLSSRTTCRPGEGLHSLVMQLCSMRFPILDSVVHRQGQDKLDKLGGNISGLRSRCFRRNTTRFDSARRSKMTWRSGQCPNEGWWRSNRIARYQTRRDVQCTTFREGTACLKRMKGFGC